MKCWKMTMAMAALFWAGLLLPTSEAAVGVSREQAMVGGEPVEIMVYKEWSDKPQPLIVINHGGSTEAELQMGFRGVNFDAQAAFLAEQGYVVALPTRRGYGRSLSKYREWDFTRYNPRQAVENGAQDVLAAIAQLKTKEYVDKHKIVVMGYSFGGFIAVCIGAKQLDGVVGVVSFAGGARSSSGGVFDASNAGPLFACYKEFGKTTKVPELWIYTKDDDWYPANFVRGMQQNFNAAGGRAEVVTLAGTHDFFLRPASIGAWWKQVGPYLNGLGLQASAIARPTAKSI